MPSCLLQAEILLTFTLVWPPEMDL